MYLARLHVWEKAELDVFRLHEHGLWATMQQEDAP